MLEKPALKTPLSRKKILASAKEIRGAAVALLARRDYARRELYRKLSQRIDQHELLNHALDQLVADGLQNDERFAESYTRFRRLKGVGPTRIKAELREKGISENLLAQIINKDDPRWLASAKTVLQKKYGETQPVSVAEKAKRIKFLSYRGFEFEQIELALNDE